MSNGKTVTVAAPTAPPATAALALPAKIAIVDSNANPAPLGLLCFALTTILLSAHNAGFFGSRRHDPGDGRVLRRHRPGVRRGLRVAQEQYVREHRLHLLRIFLADARRYHRLSETRNRRTAERTRWAPTSEVGPVVVRHVRRHVPAEQGAAGPPSSWWSLLSHCCPSAISSSAEVRRLAGFLRIALGFADDDTGLAQVLNELYGPSSGRSARWSRKRRQEVARQTLRSWVCGWIPSVSAFFFCAEHD